MGIFKSFTLTVLIGIFAVGLTLASARAATLIVDGSGQLTGAQNVDLGSLGFFDVTFVDGTCVFLFSGCDNALDDFDFTSQADAQIASQALLDLVFIDTAAGNFDSAPNLTTGCTASISCQIIIPFAMSADPSKFTGLRIINSIPSFPDQIATVDFARFGDTAALGNATFAANFSQVTVIPLPPAALLFGTALVGLAGLKRRRRQA